jgi:phenylalanyl-tRNA synthetase beta chain
MRFLLSWIREYVRLPEKGERVAQLLTEHAFETAVVPPGARASLEDILVGEVVSVRKHPHADRLSVVTVRIGKTSRAVVCGAPNVREGLRVAVALPGAKLVSEHGTLRTLGEATVRGVESHGMICSERELGLGSTHTEILELPQEANVGARCSTLFPVEVVLEADVLPNRAADCSSHIGIARELGAILRQRVQLPQLVLSTRTARTPAFQVTVEDRDLCPRYIAVVLDGIRMQPSPLWMQARLRSLGVRPQNLVVDVTNTVLWEVGQPTHAFDARAIRRALGVREVRKKGGERLVTLDGVERTVPQGAVVITSNDRPIALAGIMGGSDSGVREDTTRIVLEAALFHRGTVRKTVHTLGLRTDASDRFSKGLTTAHVAAGAARVIELLTKLGGARVVGLKDVYPRKEKPHSITLAHRHLEQVLGMSVESTTVRSTLAALGFLVSSSGGNYRVTPARFRTDLTIPEDIIEEVGRLVGYDTLPSHLPLAPISPAVLPMELQDIRRAQDTLKGAGWLETYTYSFMQEEEALALRLDTVENLQIVNPVARDHVRLRTSLLPNLLHLAWSAVKKEPLLKVFEVGHVYPGKGEERTHVAGLIIRRGEKSDTDFYEIKGTVEHVLSELGLPDVWFDPTDPTPQDSFLFLWEGGATAEAKSGTEELGFVGTISSEILNRFRIQGTIVAFELHLSRIHELERAKQVYHPPLPYPTVQRDLSLRVPADVLVDEIHEAVGQAGGPLVQDVDFVDLYDDPSGQQRGVTIRITYGSTERTLRDEEVNSLHRRIVSDVEEKLGVEERT